MSNMVRTWLTLLCSAFLIFAMNALVTKEGYLTSSYFDSPAFLTVKQDFEEGLSMYVLNVPNEEKLLENLTVSDEEIQAHRDYYGTLEEQIANIELQYEERLVGANEAIQKRLVNERDTKIADITQNFESDEYVREKIMLDKEHIVKEYMKDFQRERQNFLATYTSFVYKFTNINTLQDFENGEIFNYFYAQAYEEGGTHFTAADYFVGDGVYERNQTSMTFPIQTQEIQYFTGEWQVAESFMTDEVVAIDYQQFERGKFVLWLTVIGGILSGAALLTIAKPQHVDWQKPAYVKEIIQRWPIDVRIFCLLLAIYGLALVSSMLLDHILHTADLNRFGTMAGFVLEMATLVFLTGTVLALSGWIWQSLATEQRLKDSVKGSLVYRFLINISDLFSQRSIAIQSLLLIACVFLSGVSFVGLLIEGGAVFGLLFFVSMLLGVPTTGMFLMRMGYLNRIMKQTEQWSYGNYEKIAERGNSPFTQHALTLNKLQEGLKGSVQAQQKSERLKTELISNVSHDLRTPLTSIITYTDLLKQPTISDDKRLQYVEVLDKKSQRLKTLIEDLFEVSKMATGNIELNRTRVDLTQLLQQAIAEQASLMEDAQLECRVTLPNAPVIAYVDGQKWWRVLDNLLVNAAKYSLPNTRVYITLRQTENLNAEITVKNITRYELPEEPNELLERFKRGDSSRHTEGSGLGLAIAQSIVDLHEGAMNIEVDGDVFKVTVTMPTAY